MLRILSWLMAFVAYFGPPVWAYYAIEADRRAQLAAYGWVCGNPLIGINLQACLASAGLSFLGMGCALICYRKLPKPKRKMRTIELGVVSVPFIVGGAYLLQLL